jgi:hypothetical protein
MYKRKKSRSLRALPTATTANRPLPVALQAPQKINNFLDGLVLGPAMIYSGLGRALPRPLRFLVLLTGIGTVINGLNKIYASESESNSRSDSSSSNDSDMR